MNVVLSAVRKVAALPLVSGLTRFGPLLRVTFALRGTLVTETLRFALNELRPGERRATYSLRESGVRVTLRHHTPDVLILDEIYSQGEYEPPDAATVALRSLGRPIRVLDLGANIGLFGAWVLGRFPVESIHGFEPDPANAEVHEDTIAANAGRSNWSLTKACAAASTGKVQFHAGEFTLSHLASADEEGISLPAVDVLPMMGEVDLVKLDIEGAEWEILLDGRFTSCAPHSLVLEYHQEASPEPDPRALAERVLRDAGFVVQQTNADPGFGTGLIWAWRP